jgi:hypothetical protein
MSAKLGEASVATLHPIMRVVLDAVRGAEKAGASVWDGLATYASTEERKALDHKGLRRAVQSQIEAAAPLYDADWNPNTVSTFRVYRKLITDAREYGIAVALEADGEVVARSVGDVRADVKAAREAAKGAEAGEADDANGSSGSREFDALPPDERITAALSFIRKAYAELPTLEAKAAARDAVRALATEIGC